MLGPIRKFSTSIFAKVFLFIVAIPFVFWGMGDLFRGGNQNTIAQIGDEKLSAQEFIDYINSRNINQAINESLIDQMLTTFIGEKIINLEVDKLGIKLSDQSLGKIIKNDKNFLRDNKFSRVEYEKFLVKNNISAVGYEKFISDQNKKMQLFDFIGGGIAPSFFMVNSTFDKINQERNIQIINLNDVFKNTDFSENEINNFFNENKNKFEDIHRTIKFLELNTKKLTGTDDSDELFFEKIDEIDNLIAEGNNIDSILNKFNLSAPEVITINKLGKVLNAKNKNLLFEKYKKELIKMSNDEPTILIEHESDYILVELIKTQAVQKKITDKSVINEIKFSLNELSKRKLLAQLIGKINSNQFEKIDFDNFSKKENSPIKKISIKKKNDNSLLKQNLVDQIYSFPKKKVVVISEFDLSENYLVYIDNIKNKTITKNSEDYNKYLRLTKLEMINRVYNSYDKYLRAKYEIEINHKALKRVKNFF